MTDLTSIPDKLDALVVGAGPAGTTVATLLLQKGHSVALVERQSFPRFKVCGGCLNQSSLRGLIDAGLIQCPTDLPGKPYSAVQIHSHSQTATLPLPAGLAIGRAELDHTLTNAAVSLGVQIAMSTKATLLPSSPSDPHRQVCLEADDQQRTIRARLVIDATGLGSKFSAIPWRHTGPARLGVGTILRSDSWDGPAPAPNHLQMINGRAGYLGIAHLSDHQLDIAASLDPQATRQLGISGALASIFEEVGLSQGHAIHHINWKGTPRLNCARKTLGAHRLLLLGDAAGYIEPFTGEGMAWGIQGAHLLSQLAEEAINHWSPRVLDRYTYARRPILQRQRVCRYVTALLRRPRLAATALRVLRLRPSFSSPLTRAMNRRPAHA
ncbi:NAD(P)/FAD-dependent oxidoreductase [Mucisphaera sp.]|uniref:NAD(P)/FAD-dependent oxidoreductase n=1 Tax=Mucisphaera sp. TaxID=2913024 RepID=UPI003D105E0D